MSPDLDAWLDQPLPDAIAVGGGTALFLKGRVKAHDGRRIEGLSIGVDGAEHPADSDGEMWWGLVPLAAVGEPTSAELSVNAQFDDGARARAGLGTTRLEPALDIEPVAAPSAVKDASRPLIAVCMATYEPPLELFAKQIESIRAQTYPSWVCVISDDSSRPERVEEMRRILGDDERFVLSPSEHRLGFYRNFERALALAPAEAEYIGLSDQDDQWHPDKLETLAGELEAGAGLAYSDTRVIDEGGRELSDTYWRYRRNNYTDLTSLLITNSITGAAALFRREVVEAALPFPPPQGDIFHDHWLALVAMATGEIRYVDRPLYDYVQHPGAAIGFVNANAGRGRWGGRLADLVLRVLRLGYRLMRPVGQIRYFDNYCRLVLEARALEARFGPSLSATHRRALARIESCDRSRSGAAWLVYRALRPLTGRNETMGMERGLLAGVLWARKARLRRRIAQGRLAR